MKFIDIHCHLNFSDYDIDREEVIAQLQKEEIGVINVGTDVETSRKVIELAEQHENMWATVGIHPTDTKGVFDMEPLEELAKHPKVVAIGECGLDYFHAGPDEIPKQREIFIKHIELANKVGKPLMLHVRNGKENTGAYQEALEILKKHARTHFNFHFFAGTAADMQAIMDIGGTISMTGVVTFARTYDEVIKNVPLDRIMSETDAPFAAPIPYRGKRNNPLYIKEISAKIAEIRGESIDIVQKALVDNARKVFGI